jgi:HAE1 family hydrophobic/amphiphilic exporter-1
MSLSGLAIKRPLAAAAVNLGLLVLGILALLRMPVSLFPEVRLPFVTVRVAMPGATAQQVETTIAKVLEPEFSKISGLARQITFVRPNGVEFILGFRFGLPQIEALNGVRNALDGQVRRLPSEALTPEIRAVDPSQTPVLIEVLEKQLADADASRLLGKIRSVAGIASAEIIGQSEASNWFRMDPARVRDLQIAPLEVFQNLATQFAKMPWGDFLRGAAPAEAGSVVPVWARTKHPETMLLADGRALPLSGIGEFRSEVMENSARVLVNESRTAAIAIFKRPDANTLDVVERVQKILKEWRSESQVSSFTALDQSSYIRENAKEVWVALIWGGMLAMLTVAIFLRDVRSGFITGTALPVSICGTFLIIALLGFSLNMLTLLALSLAVGLLIDDAVIVRESISRELERGAHPQLASLRGTERVFAPVIATTLCVAAVFFPVAMMSGVVGQFFREFGLTICVAVGLSAAVAFTLDPMLSAYFSKSTKRHPESFDMAARRSQRSSKARMRRVLAFSDWCYRYPIPVILLSVALCAVSIAYAVKSGVDFMASEDKDQVLVEIVARPGSGPDKLDEATSRVSGIAEQLNGVRRAIAFVANGADAGRALVRVILEPKNDRGNSRGHLAIAAELRTQVAKAGLDVLVREPPPIEGVGGEPPLSMYLYGNDIDEAQKYARELQDRLGKIPGTGSVVIDTAGIGAEVLVTVDQVRALSAGVDPARILATGRLMLSGLSADYAGGTASGLSVGALGDLKQRSDALKSALVPGASGRLPLSDFVTFSAVQQPQAIDRENGSRKVVIYGAPDGTLALSKILQGWQGIAESVREPFRAEIGGDREIFEEMISNFSTALIGGALFVFVVLVVLYESLWLPLIVILSLPLAAVGGLLSLSLSGDRLAMGSLIGFVLLLGISAKNAILLVDAASADMARFGGRLATIRAVKSRMRPILMTSIALAIGMLPTVFLRGAGSEFRSPMALSIIGGIISSTLLSFFVIPAFFGCADRIGLVRWLQKRRSQV